MPPLPQGMQKRKVRTKRGATVVYYWRRREGDRDQRIALGSDYAKARTRFDAFRKNPPPLTPTVAPSPLVTVEAFSRRWLAEYAATNRVERARAGAEQRFRDYLWPTLGSMPLVDLKASDIRQLNAGLDKRSVGLVTRRRLLEDLRCALNYAVQEAEVLERSPWVSGKKGLLPKLPEYAPDPLNEMELAEVLKVAPEKWKPVLQTLAHTGLRWGELRALRWKDVREAPYPHLVVGKSHDGPTKSRRVREVPLLPEAQQVLNGLTRGSGPVFSLPETASWIRRYVIRHSRVKDFCVHRLRHTHACRYLERGGSVEALQRTLGHSTVRLTERYGRLSPLAVAAEVARVSRCGGDRSPIGGTVGGTVAVSGAAEAAK